MTPPATTQMQCQEVWGGNQLTTQGVAFGGLDACVHSRPHGGAKSGGDVYYASSCATGRISRLLLADVAGHGAAVASTATDLRTLMRRFVNRLDQTEFVKLLNQQFAAMATTGAFASAVVVTFFAPSRRLIVCNAGHPRPLIYRAARQSWDFLCSVDAARSALPCNIPLGLLDISEYEQFDVELNPGDRVLTYTDALLESYDAEGEMLGEEGVLRLVRALATLPPAELTAALLAEIESECPGGLDADDVTVMIITATGLPPENTLADKAGALLRFTKACFSRDPVPFPDFNLPSLGATLIPALARRWRGRK